MTVEECAMKSCSECGGTMNSTVLPEYVDDLMGSGAPVVLVNSVTELKCPHCGLEKIEIPDFDGLVAAVSLARSLLPLKLRGTELRFLRKALGLSARDLAARIGVNAETLSRWENNREPIKQPVEKLVRLMVGASLTDRAPAIAFDSKAVADMRILSVCGEPYPAMQFERMKVRIYPNPAETYWDRLETAA
jgi:transcriptional regulator with XRE-family HTH domain